MKRTTRINSLIVGLIVLTAATASILFYGAAIPGQQAFVVIGVIAVLAVAVILITYTVRTGRAGGTAQRK